VSYRVVILKSRKQEKKIVTDRALSTTRSTHFVSLINIVSELLRGNCRGKEQADEVSTVVEKYLADLLSIPGSNNIMKSDSLCTEHLNFGFIIRFKITIEQQMSLEHIPRGEKPVSASLTRS